MDHGERSSTGFDAWVPRRAFSVPGPLSIMWGQPRHAIPLPAPSGTVSADRACRRDLFTDAMWMRSIPVPQLSTPRVSVRIGTGTRSVPHGGQLKSWSASPRFRSDSADIGLYSAPNKLHSFAFTHLGSHETDFRPSAPRRLRAPAEARPSTNARHCPCVSNPGCTPRVSGLQQPRV